MIPSVNCYYNAPKPQQLSALTSSRNEGQAFREAPRRCSEAHLGWNASERQSLGLGAKCLAPPSVLPARQTGGVGGPSGSRKPHRETPLEPIARSRAGLNGAPVVVHALRCVIGLHECAVCDAPVTHPLLATVFTFKSQSTAVAAARYNITNISAGSSRWSRD